MSTTVMTHARSISGLATTLTALALGTALLAGCASSGGTAPAKPVTGSNSATAFPTQSTTPSESSSSATNLGALLETIALKKTDLRSGEATKLYPEGNQVEGQVTLDGCGYDFTSEAKRIARRQYSIFGKGFPAGELSNEVVAYDSAADAANALNQWETAVRTCPKTPQVSDVEGVPPLTYSIDSEVVNAPTLPVRTNVTTVLTATGSGQRLHGMLIFQQYGRVLDGVYLMTTTSATSAGESYAKSLAKITGKRLMTTEQ